MACPALQELAALLVGERVDDDVRAHVKGCTSCRRRVAELSKTTLAPSKRVAVELAQTETPKHVSTAMANTETPDHGAHRASMRLLARGAQIGRYVVSELLGAGGMGVVYAAYDPQLDRRVAVKVLRSGFAKNVSGARQLLLDEAKAMAKLSHPNVVTVHDVGVFEDQVFLAMELVEGQTLRELMRSAPPQRDLIRTLVHAGRGLAAAHKAGLVHRDFKPENVLIGRDGRVCVSDFGVARTAQVDSGDVAGTPLYMAPEAHDGVIDPRSDQYSFCLTLLEVVTGQPPAIEPQPEKAPVGLRRIITRGLSKEPGGRFPTMDALLAELAPRRRRALWLSVGAGGLVAVATISIIAATRKPEPCTSAGTELAPTWGPHLARDVRAAFPGEAKAEHAVTALDAWGVRWVGEHTRVCKATRVDGTQSVELLDLRMECLRGRANAVRAIVGQLLAGDRGALAYAASSIPNAGDLTRCAGDKDALRSLAVLRDPALAGRADQLRAQLAEVEATHWSGRAKKVAVLAAALAKQADAADVALMAAPARYFGGFAAVQLGDKTGSAALLRAAILDADRTGDDELRLRAQVTLAQVYTVENKAELAEEVLVAAEATVGRLGKRQEHVSVLQAQRGNLLFTQGRYDESIALARAAVEGFERIGKLSDPSALAARLLIGMNLEAKGDAKGAREVYEQTIVDLDRRLGADSPQVAAPTAYLGAMEMSQGDLASARARFERAIGILDAALGDEAMQTSVWRGQLAVLLANEGEVTKAREQIAKALTLVSGPGARVERATLMTSLGDIERNAGNHTAAIAAYDEALAGLEAHFGSEHPGLTDYLVRRGDAHRSAKHFDAAKRDLDLAARITEQHQVGGMDQIQYYAGINAQEAGRANEARGAFERCIASKTESSHAMLIAECERLLAELIVSTDRKRAVDLARHARAAFVEGKDDESVKAIDDWLATRGK